MKIINKYEFYLLSFLALSVYNMLMLSFFKNILYGGY